MVEILNIWHATKHNQIAYLIEYFTDCSTEIDTVNEFGETCLHIACKYGYIDIVLLLIKLQCNLNITDLESNWTALHIAAYNNQLHCYSTLIKYGVDIDINDNCALTAAELLQGSLQQHALSWYKLHAKHRIALHTTKNSIDETICFNCIYTCGYNTSNQIGNVRVERYQAKPKVLHAIDGVNIKLMDTNKYESAVVDTAGQMYMWGKKYVEPTLIQLNTDSKYNIVSLSMSDELTCIVCEVTVNNETTNILLLQGNNVNKFVTDANVTKTQFTQLHSVDSVSIASAVCSDNRIILLTDVGTLYIVGQSLIDDTFSVKPQLILLPDNVSVQQVLCDADILLVLTIDGDVLQYREKRFMRVHFKLSNTIRERTTKWRSNTADIHQLNTIDSTNMTRNRLIVIRKIAMCAAANRGLAVSYDGKVYDFKLNIHNNKSLNGVTTSPTIKPFTNKSSILTQSPPAQPLNVTHKQRNARIEARLIDSVTDEFFNDIAIRRGQSCMITDTGHVYTFGLDCLGTNSNVTKGVVINVPTKIQHLSQVTGVCLGTSHMLLTVATHKHNIMYNKRKSISEHITTQVEPLRLICEKQLASSIIHKQHIYTLQFALQHQFYYLANYVTIYILRNIQMLLSNALQQMNVVEWYFINKCYHQWNIRQSFHDLITLNNEYDNAIITAIEQYQADIKTIEPVQLSTRSPKIVSRSITHSTPKSSIPASIQASPELSHSRTEPLPQSSPELSGTITPINTVLRVVKESKPRTQWSKMSLNDSRSLLQTQPTSSPQSTSSTILTSMQSNTTTTNNVLPPTRSPKWSPLTATSNAVSLLQIQQQQQQISKSRQTDLVKTPQRSPPSQSPPSRSPSMNGITLTDSLSKTTLSSYLPTHSPSTKKWNTTTNSPILHKLTDIQSYESMQPKSSVQSTVAWASLNNMQYIQPCKLVDLLSEQMLETEQVPAEPEPVVTEAEPTTKTVKNDKSQKQYKPKTKQHNTNHNQQSCANQNKSATKQVWAKKKDSVAAV